MEKEKLSGLDEYEFDLEQAEESANCNENWTLLLRSRLLDSSVIDRWFDYRDKFFVSEEGKGILNQAKTDFPKLVDRVFNKTDVSISGEVFRDTGEKYLPHNASVGRFGESGVVFYDATDLEGSPLSLRGKAIVEAHEKAHGVLNSYNLAEVSDILSGFDVEEFLKNTKYKKDQVVYEFVARMGQLKNYFGIKGSDAFTKAHLDYARENYLKDVTYNNRMDVFFKSITPEKEEKFLQLMNSIAC